MSLFNHELVRRIRKMRRTKLKRRFGEDQPLEKRTKIFLRKKTSWKVIWALFGFVLIFMAQPVHASKILDARAAPVIRKQTSATSSPVSTPQPTTVPAPVKPGRITTGLVVLFVVGLLIALAMVGFGLGLGLWMKRRDKS